MRWNKNSIYAAVLGLGGAGLIIDRLVIGHAPSAAAADGGEAAAVEELGAANPTDDWVLPEVPFPTALSPFEASAVGRNPFMPPGAEAQGPKANDPKETQEPQESTAQSFPGRHLLEAIYISEDQRLVVLDGRIMRIGDLTQENCRLVEIDPTRVRFQCPDGEVELWLYGK